MNALHRRALDAYEYVTYDTALESSGQLDMIKLLFRALTDALVDARTCTLNGKYERKSHFITKAQHILIYLRDTLDFENGGDLAYNLDALYEYCMRRISHANAKKDTQALEEVHKLMSMIGDSWHQVPYGVRPVSQ